MGLGLISEPSRLFVYNDIGTFIVLTYVYLPFAILVLYASLERFDYTQLTAAQDLGASHPGVPATSCCRRSGPAHHRCDLRVHPDPGRVPDAIDGRRCLRLADRQPDPDVLQERARPTGRRAGPVIVAFVTVLLIIFRKYLRVEDVYARG
jgi:hypothetical protein